MTSISKSNILAEVKNLNLDFTLRQYHSDSLRDVFIGAIKNPIKLLLRNDEKLEALKNINLKVEKGERVALIGKNGAGKTSLCRCLAEMYVPTSGDVNVHEDTRSIFDSSVGILPELTGRENANLLARFMYPKLSKSELENLVREALEFSELRNFIDTPYKYYSNGMQTRLTLSLISAYPCELLILDEIFDGADQFFRNKVSKRVLEMIEKSGAVIFVSHSTENVRIACNRVVVLNKGEIIFDGNVDEGIKVYESLDPEGSF